MEMPKMDGAAACAEMRKVPALKATPIIIMSATGSQENRELALKAGCTDFVVKPQKPEDFLGIVAHVLALKKREATRITVVFDVTGSQGSRQVIGQAKNVSETGLLLETASPIAVGSVLNLEFYLPGTRAQVKVKAQVVRSAKSPEGAEQAGMRFIDLSQEDQAQILDYVAS
jgi:response regulator RpfG family c-di-GMP phosphodiesterase